MFEKTRWFVYCFVLGPLLAACVSQARPAQTPIPTLTVSPAPQSSATPCGDSCPTPLPVSTPITLNELPPPDWRLTLTIWHSWDEAQVQALGLIIQTFQNAYPNVHFDLLYVPKDGLKDMYMQQTYLGRGPSLFFGPAEWGPELTEQALVADLTPYITPEFAASLSAPAAELARVGGRWIGLPYQQSGVVLYRNASICPQAAATFEDWVTRAQGVTGGGVVGADLERGAYFSAAHLLGLGGALMDKNGQPAFNSPQGLAWLQLLRDFERAGPVELNTNRDLGLFEEGKAGWIIEGTWNRGALAQAVGPENLHIDPWPTAAGKRMAGFVWAENIYMNVNLEGDDQSAVMQFMGYLLAPEMQNLLAEVGFIPTMGGAQPRDVLTQEAIAALKGGFPIPVNRFASAYWDPLATALYLVFERGFDPADALAQAEALVRARLAELPTPSP
jgi:maltose-binding protein MalE